MIESGDHPHLPVTMPLDVISLDIKIVDIKADGKPGGGDGAGRRRRRARTRSCRGER
jgi:hypothetical protein